MPTDAARAVHVAAATPDDWVVVRALRLAGLSDTPEAFCATLEGEQQLDEAAWRRRLERPEATTLVAWSHGEPVEPMGLMVVEPWDEGDVAGIASVWVAPGGRGRGVGDALLDAALDVARARGYRRAALEVGDDNLPAQRLYARHGFTPTGRTSTMPPPKAHVTEHELARDL